MALLMIITKKRKREAGEYPNEAACGDLAKRASRSNKPSRWERSRLHLRSRDELLVGTPAGPRSCHDPRSAWSGSGGVVSHERDDSWPTLLSAREPEPPGTRGAEIVSFRQRAEATTPPRRSPIPRRKSHNGRSWRISPWAPGSSVSGMDDEGPATSKVAAIAAAIVGSISLQPASGAEDGAE